MNSLSKLGAVLLTLLAPAAHAASIVVPNSLAATEAGANGCFPFNCTASMRYQQAYAAGQFGSAPITIQEIAFRVDGDAFLADSFTRQVELQVNLSTAALAVGSLSTTFANNVGTDETVVLPQQTLLLDGTQEGTGGPNPFDVVLVLDQTFDYDPNLGDLLLDVRIFSALQILPLTGESSLDYTSSESSLHRIYFGDVNSTFGTTDPFEGLVTQFTFVPEPASAALLVLGLLGLAERRRATRRP